MSADQRLKENNIILPEGYNAYAFDDSSYPSSSFVWEELGQDTYMSLLGSYILGPRWKVRFAKFDGPVESRAREIMISMDFDGNILRFNNRFPEAEEGKQLSRSEAQIIAENALSENLELTIKRDGQKHQMTFKDGDAQSPLKVIGKCGKETGTEIKFLPSKNIFTMIEFDRKTLQKKLRELAFLNSKISILLQDFREDKPWEKIMSYEGGLKEFVKYLDQSKKAMIDEPISLLANKDGIEVNLALWWNDSYYETVNCFTNNIPQKDGGTHLAGLRGALTRVVNSYAQESGMSKKENVQLVGDDIREGLTCVLSIKVADPKFSSQTKDKLVSSEVRPVVESLVNDALSEWFEEHPSEAKNIISKVIEAAALEVNSIFISVDPERDNVEIINDYVSAFHNQIIGLTGNKEQISNVAKDWGVYYQKEFIDGSAEYTVNHLDIIFLANANGEFIDFFPPKIQSALIVEKVRNLIKSD